MKCVINIGCTSIIRNQLLQIKHLLGTYVLHIISLDVTSLNFRKYFYFKLRNENKDKFSTPQISYPIVVIN